MTLYTLNGETKNLTEWCNILEIKPSTVLSRISRGWSIEDAFVKNKPNKNRDITYKEETHSVKEWSKIRGISISTIYHRLDMGYNTEYVLGFSEMKGNYDRSKKHEKIIECEGESHTVREWSEIRDIKASTIYRRLNKGLSPEEALEFLPTVRGTRPFIIQYNGESHSVKEWASILNIPEKTIRYRYNNDIPIDDPFDNRNRNKSKLKSITYNGETHTIAEWSSITGINQSMIYSRMNKGLSPEEILENRHKKGRRSKLIEYEGQSHSVPEWAAIRNIPVSSLWKRIECNWPIEEALGYKEHKIADNGFILAYDGQSHTVREWAKIINVSEKTICNRINKGYNIKKVLEPKKEKRIITCNGKSHSVPEWAKILGVTKANIYDKINRGLTDEEIILGRNPYNTITYNGETHSCRDWDRLLNRHPGTTYRRKCSMWDDVRNIETPVMKKG